MSKFLTTLLALCLSSAALANTITVDTTADGVVVDGNCTCREAVIAANTNSAVDGCAAGSGADLILLPAGTILLASGSPHMAISATLTISGQGAGVSVISGNKGSRSDTVFEASVPLSLHLKYLSLNNSPGDAGYGGAVLIEDDDANLTVTACSFEGNVASIAGGAICGFGGGDISIFDSYFGSNDSSLGSGGAVASNYSESLQLQNCTFYGNTASGQGAAVMVDHPYASGVVRHCTFFENTSGASTLTLFNGLGNILVLDRNIFYHSTPFEGRLMGNYVTPFDLISAGGNVFSDVNTIALHATDTLMDPELSAAAFNGGSTKTCLLGANSSALNRGLGSSLGFDQRGVARPQGPHADSGAYESTLVGPSPTSTHTPTATPSDTPTVTPTATPSDTETITPSFTDSPSPTATPTVTPTDTLTATASSSPSASPSVTTTVTPSASPTVTGSSTPSATPSPSPTDTGTDTPSATPSVSPSGSPSHSPSPTKSPTPTLSPTPSPSPSPSPSPTSVALCASYSYQWGNGGTANGQFIAPSGVAVASDGSVYVTELSGNRIQKFDASGAFLLKWGTAGSGGAGQFISPQGIAVSPGGLVYVADYINARIQRFDASGGAGTIFISPVSAQAIAVDASDNLYVLDYQNNRVLKYNASGTQTASWGSFGGAPGQFYAPSGLALGPDGLVYVAESTNRRVQAFDSSGAFQRQFGISMSSGPMRMTAAQNGDLFISSYWDNRVEAYSNLGQAKGVYNLAGSAPGQLNQPDGLAAKGGLLYVADSANRVQAFNINCQVGTPTSTPTPSPSFSASPSFSPSPTPSLTPSVTPTATETLTRTPTPSASPSPTESPTFTISPTPTESPTISPTFTVSPTGQPEPNELQARLGPSPVRRGIPLCLSVNGSYQAATLGLHNSGGHLVASTPRQISPCLGTDALAPGFYFAVIKVELSRGTETKLQKIVILNQ